jgi:hypothetical protein
MILLLFLLPILVMMIGFSVDLAHMLRVRSQLQVATDLATKSGAGTLSRSQNTQTAIDAILEVALANEVAGEGLVIDPADIQFGRSTKQADGTWFFDTEGTPINSVRVTGRRDEGSPGGPINLFFGRFYGVGAYTPVATASAAFVDVDVCLVLDRSSSMKLTTSESANMMSTSDPRFCQQPQVDSRWVALANASKSFINGMNNTIADEKVALVSFATNYTSCSTTNTAASIDHDLTTNLAAVTSAMDARTSSVWNGATDIHAGITRGNTVLTGPNARGYTEKIMILFTDGAYTGQNPMSAATASKNAKIKIITITFGSDANQADMQQIAALTGGHHYHAPDAAALDLIFQKIAANIEFLIK